MGLFSSKKKTQVGTAIQRVVEDNALPATAKSSIIRSIMRDEEGVSLTDNLIQDLQGNLAGRVQQVHAWAGANYTYGVPTCHLGDVTQGEAIVKGIIQAQIAQTVLFDYFYYAPLNPLHAGWIQLIASHGYNPVSNELTILSGTNGAPTYLKNMVVVYTTASYNETYPANFDQWGTSPLGGYTPERVATSLGGYAAMPPVIVDASATSNYVECTAVYQNLFDALGAPSLTLVTHTSTFTLSLASYNDAASYYHVKYRYTAAAVEHIGYWLYEDEAGTYPTVDLIHQDTYTELGDFYPWVHFIDDEFDLGGPTRIGTPDHVSSVKLCKYLGMDYQSLCDSIQENPAMAENVSNSNVEQAMMIFAVAPNSPHAIGQQYLFDFFNALTTAEVAGAGTDYRSLADRTSGRINRPGRSIVLKDREFAMTLRYSSLEKTLRAGTIAPVGTSVGLVEVVTTNIGLGFRANALTAPVISIVADPTEGHIFRRQVTTATYEEIRVYGLALEYHIWPSKSFSAGFGADSLLIPLDHAIVSQYSILEREQLYGMSMHMVFNSRVTTKVHWYQQSWFRIVLTVAAIVWALYTQDWATLGKVLATQGVQAAVLLLLQQLAIDFIYAYVIQLGLTALARLIGGKLALILATIAAFVALAKGYAVGSLKGCPWAEDLLKLAAGLAHGAELDIQRQLGKLEDRFERLTEKMEEGEKELARGRALLGTDDPVLIDIFELMDIQPITLLGERPQDYFSRTIESGNIGILSLTAISTYVASSLTLPTLTESEGAFYGYV